MIQFLLTGANGFVGRALAERVARGGDDVCCVIRGAPGDAAAQSRYVRVADNFAGIEAAWPADLRPDCVVHLAARVHMLNDHAADALDAFRQTNVAGTLRVAEAAVRAGVRRFVFVSSIKAVGEQDGGTPLRESDVPQPRDPYGVSKLEAEQALREFGAAHGMQVVIVRPPLVYGPGVRANFLSLMSALDRGLPLPLGAVYARRSLVFVDNLVDALVHCATRPEAAGQTFHVSDGVDLSVPELARTIAHHLQVSCRLVPVPVPWLRAVGRLTGRTEQVSRLVESLRVDIHHIRDTLGWTPPLSADDGLRATADWYRASQR
ncbi:GDP-6-deoxy-D-mannose reductase [Paraburkholderia caffeinitolerans]|uniref:GDP-6-deoxy-D-mannose reductase n=1 Tax=Paraburkholderia caffeinitolerans TaxID=1723730 RepID=A0A6J5FE56_9BURK|nr:SDR family oxidoreductase [Paraburkholderia caffeinitolerans]CAB3776408.1 GDP-6-deoxy-D-mannose reductase [Paraburkholderia caffeinitolerans]